MRSCCVVVSFAALAALCDPFGHLAGPTSPSSAVALGAESPEASLRDGMPKCVTCLGLTTRPVATDPTLSCGDALSSAAALLADEPSIASAFGGIDSACASVGDSADSSRDLRMPDRVRRTRLLGGLTCMRQHRLHHPLHMPYGLSSRLLRDGNTSSASSGGYFFLLRP